MVAVLFDDLRIVPCVRRKAPGACHSVPRAVLSAGGRYANRAIDGQGIRRAAHIPAGSAVEGSREAVGLLAHCAVVRVHVAAHTGILRLREPVGIEQSGIGGSGHLRTRQRQQGPARIGSDSFGRTGNGNGCTAGISRQERLALRRSNVGVDGVGLRLAVVQHRALPACDGIGGAHRRPARLAAVRNHGHAGQAARDVEVGVFEACRVDANRLSAVAVSIGQGRWTAPRRGRCSRPLRPSWRRRWRSWLRSSRPP